MQLNYNENQHMANDVIELENLAKRRIREY
jgi:hypothetical protein